MALFPVLSLRYRLTVLSETAFSIIRLVALTHFSISDVTWNYLPPILWSSIEVCVGIICACLPVMAPLIPRFSQARLSSRESHNTLSFRPTKMPGKTGESAEQRFEQLDEIASLDLERQVPLQIRRTTDIIVHKERMNGHGQSP